MAMSSSINLSFIEGWGARIAVVCRFSTAKCGIDTGDQFGAAKWLGDVIIATHFEGFNFLDFGVLAGEKDDWYFDSVLAETVYWVESGRCTSSNSRLAKLLFRKRSTCAASWQIWLCMPAISS
jgi:hypothetical protein